MRVLGDFLFLDSILLLCFSCFSTAFWLLRLFASVAFWLLRLLGFCGFLAFAAFCFVGFLASFCQSLSGRSCNLLTFLGFVALLP